MAIYKDVEPFEKFTHPNDSEDFVFGVGFVLDKLYDLPVADVVEVKHGEWTYYRSPIHLSGYLHYRCSNCGESDPWLNTTRGHANYCPNCGAKMDGKEQGDGKL